MIVTLKQCNAHTIWMLYCKRGGWVRRRGYRAANVVSRDKSSRAPGATNCRMRHKCPGDLSTGYPQLIAINYII